MAPIQSISNLALLETYLGLKSRYFTSLPRRLCLTLPFPPLDPDVTTLLSRVANTLTTAALACGSLSQSSAEGDLLAESESLTTSAADAREAWEVLLGRTDKRRPNGVGVATGFAVVATERFEDELQGLVSKLMENTTGSVLGSGGHLGQGRNRRRGWGREGMSAREKEIAVRRARERAQDLGPLAAVHPSRRAGLRKAMDKAKRASEARDKRGRMMLLCIEI